MCAWCYGYVYGFNSTGKLSYKSIRIVGLLGVMSKQTKSFCLVAYCSGDHSDLNYARGFMLSGHPDYEPFDELKS